MHDIASFGRWVKLRRIALELTQADLATFVGCAVITIRKIEADERRPSTQIAERLARHLNLAPQERAAFIQAAQATLSPIRLAPPTHAVVSNPQRGYIPIPSTALIGRNHELVEVCTRLRRSDVRLLTLTGSGGVGKTRLAIQAATQLRAEFADGVWFVALAPITDPALVMPTIAQALGVQEIQGQSLQETVQITLRARRLLLLLDNFEQILDAVVQVAALLEDAPTVKLLVTSRAALHLTAEHQFAVPPLTLPDAQAMGSVEQLTRSEAAALFIARAQAVKRDFIITPANAPAIAAICTRLDGLPLAIELAASRCKAFPPTALLALLERRLDTLTGGARDLPTRQHTLRATIDWSYTLLAPAEQRLFAWLAVFVGGWTVAAAAAVCTTVGELRLDVVMGIEALLDQNLLQEDTARVGAVNQEPRFTMLETMREYALELLAASGAVEALRRQHAQYFLALAERAEAELQSAAAPWRNRLTAEHDNLWAALTWMLERNQIEAGLRLGAALRWFWIMRGALSEGRRWLETLLARTDQVQISNLVRANAQVVAADLALMQHDVLAAIPLLEASLQLYQSAGEPQGIARVLRALGQSAIEHGEPARGVTLIDESLAHYRELGDTCGTAEALLSRSCAAADWEGDYALATALAEESVRLFRELGDLRGTRTALNQLGWRVHDQGNLEHGAELVEEALGLARDLGDRSGIMDGLGALAIILYRRGDLTRAQMLLEEQLVLARELGSANDMSSAHVHLGVTARYAGNLTQAQLLLAEGLRLGPEVEAGFWIALCRRYQADVLADQGEVAGAARIYRESLAVFRDVGTKWDCVACIEGLATVAGAQGNALRAVRLWSSAVAIREAMGAPLPPIDRPARDTALANLRAALGGPSFAALWSEGWALPLEQAIAEALM